MNKDKTVSSISTARKKRLQQFEKQAGLKFRRYTLLNQALSHRSFGNEHNSSSANNERLEFLGDAVLGLVVTEYLYHLLPEEDEGRLAKIKAFVVSEESLAGIASLLSIDNFILIGKGEERSGGRSKKAIVADAMEAVIAACFLDAGFKRAKDFVLKYWIPEINKVLEDKHRKDYKTLLQEHLQKVHRIYPKYQLIKKTGPDHARIFWMQVLVQDKTFGPCKGRSKKEAEKQAAELAYKHLLHE